MRVIIQFMHGINCLRQRVDITLLDLTTEADGWNKRGNEQK